MNEFSSRLRKEMYRFRLVVVMRICHRRGYKLSKIEIVELLSRWPESIHKILDGARRMNRNPMLRLWRILARQLKKPSP